MWFGRPQLEAAMIARREFACGGPEAGGNNGRLGGPNKLPEKLAAIGVHLSDGLRRMAWRTPVRRT